MGVRFECPAGHKLHVKTELAGKRGICPECGAKFIVPSFSGERVAEDNGAATNSTVTVNPPASQGGARGTVPGVPNPQRPAAVRSATATPPPAPATPEPVAWYIRPASGGQFGPASNEVFAEWIAAGRVSADSWVWRNGWADWRAGAEALGEFNSSVAASAAFSMPAAFEEEFDVDEPFPDIDLGVTTAPAPSVVVAVAAVETSAADVRRAEIKRRKQRVRNFSILLGVVALAMFVALVFVLSRGDEPATPPEEEEPPAATAPEAVEEPATPAEPTTPAAEPVAAE